MDRPSVGIRRLVASALNEPLRLCEGPSAAVGQRAIDATVPDRSFDLGPADRVYDRVTTKVLTRVLKPARNADDFRLHRAKLKWSLVERIIMKVTEAIRSRIDWKDRVETFHHQVETLMRFFRRLPVTLLADDAGLGKTISAGQPYAGRRPASERSRNHSFVSASTHHTKQPFWPRVIRTL